MIYTFYDGLGWKYMNKTINLSRKMCNFLSINGRKRASKLVMFDPKLPSCPGTYSSKNCTFYINFSSSFTKKNLRAHILILLELLAKVWSWSQFINHFLTIFYQIISKLCQIELSQKFILISDHNFSTK